MNNREKSYADELRRCKENIAKTKKLIEYHKNMLKKMERKEAAAKAKLDGVKLRDLRELISKGCYDIDSLREAMKAGDFSEVAVRNNSEQSAENIPQQKSKFNSDNENSPEENKSAALADKKQFGTDNKF